MKLDEAIKILQYHSERNADVPGSDWANALKLGIEAMKRCKLVAEGYQYWHERPLPGETVS